MNDHNMEEYMSQVQNYVFVPNDNQTHSELDGNFIDNSNGNNNEGESRNLNPTDSRQTEIGNNYYPGTVTNEAALISASNAQTQAILDSHHQYHLAMQQSLFQNADQLNGLSGNPNGAIVNHSGIPGPSNLHYQHGMLQSAMPLPIPISYGVLPPTASVPIPAMAIQVSNLSHAFVNSMQQNAIIAAPGPIIHDGIPLKPRSLEEEYAIILHRSASAAAKSSNTKYRCLFCNFTFVGGPQKIRVHLTGKRENGTRLSRCENCPEDVRKRLEERMKAPKEAASETGLFDDDDHHTPSLPPRNVEEHHCIVLSRSVSSNSKSSNTRYKCIYCRFKFVGGPQKIRVHLTGHPEGGTRMTKCTRVPEEVMIQMEHRRKAPKPDILTTPVGMQVLLPPHMQDGSHPLMGPGGAVIPLHAHQQAMMKQQQQAQQLHMQQQQQLQHLQRQQQMQQIQHHQQHLQQQQHLHHLQQIHQQQLQHQHLQQQHLQMPNSQGQILHAQHQAQQLHHASQQAIPLHMLPAQHLMHPSQLMMLQQQQQQQQQQSYQRHMQQQAMAQQQQQQHQLQQHHPYLNQQGGQQEHPAFSSVQEHQQEDVAEQGGQISGSTGAAPTSAEHSYETQVQSSSSGNNAAGDPAPQEDARADNSSTSNADASGSGSGSTEV